MARILVGFAKCDTCGYLARVETFGQDLKCPRCGRQNLSINPEDKTQATLGEYEPDVDQEKRR